MRSTNIVYCFVTAFSLLLAGCATTPQNSAEQNQPAQRMTASATYTAGKEAMNSGDLQGGIRHFNTLITQFPVDKFAQQGRLELAYAYHKNGQTSSVIATTERFISEHPQHKNIDYAYYLRALTAYETAIARLDEGPSSATTGPPYEAQMALEFLNELNHRFPNGKYSADASQRINELDQRIAHHLVVAATQQLDQGNPARAALLAKTVVEEHPESTAIQEAAIITNQSFKILGLSSDENRDATIARMEASLDSRKQAPAATASTTGSAPVTNLMPAGSEIRDTSWVVSQPPDRYTIQVLGTENEVLLRHQIKRGGLLDKVAYYKKSRDGIPWYSLIYGSYASRAEAQSAAQGLPPSLSKGKPWIRKIGDIQASLGE